MKVSQSIADRHSEDDFARKLLVLSDSGAGVIHVRTNEVVRALLATRKAILMDGNVYNEWNVASGMRIFVVSNMFSSGVEGDSITDIHTTLGIPGSNIKNYENSDKIAYYVYVNPQYYLESNPILHHHIQQYRHLLPSTNVRVVLITDDKPLPDPLNDLVVTLEFDPPSITELKEYVKAVMEGVEDGVLDVPDEDLDTICYAGAGMSRESFEMYTALAIVEAASKEGTDKVSTDDIIAGLNVGKTEVVNKNDILQLYPVSDMADVGGMENLKEWVAKRSKCYSDSAKEYGIAPPKGMVFVGLPGTGKSLAAKAIAKELRVPLVRLDFGRVFNSLVGSSEGRMRTALKMVESMAPCVLFCDEIDKGLGGIGGSGDSGTSNRVLGTFLSWLQDNESPVFTMVTANNITGLPPELLRRGRFDAIFSTGFPNPEEIREVLSIHLRKRGWDIKDYSKRDVQQVVNKGRGYVPAEIEAAVVDALVDAYDAEEDLEMHHVVNALDNMVPLSKTYNALIQEMALWMQNNATPASKKYLDATDDSNIAQLGGKQRKTRVRRTPVKPEDGGEE